MILESLVTTVSADGDVNLAPMGPIVDDQLTKFTLRPFHPSTTLNNLQATRRAVVHVSDNAAMFGRCVLGTLPALPNMLSIHSGDFWVLEDCCRYFAVEVNDWKDDDLRPTVECRVIETGERRPFFGFNRGKHAVLEAAILATRKHLLPRQQLLDQFEQLQILVDKTASAEDKQVFAELKTYTLS